MSVSNLHDSAGAAEPRLSWRQVAKHGNRSVSSLCGSGDVVEKMGVSVRKTAVSLLLRRMH